MEPMAHARVYFDYNATAPVRAQAARAMADAFACPGNASSVHAEVRAARMAIEAARGQLARLVGAAPANVTFTSGGTEANNLALAPGLHRAGSERRPTRLMVSAIEHPAVLNGHRFAADKVDLIPVLPSGVVDLAGFRSMLDMVEEGETMLVSVMLANNETGVVQPVSAIAELVHARGGLMHTDAVQAAGKIPLDLGALGVDLLSLSAHKVGGPQGVGALVTAQDIVCQPLVRGGGQEGNRRGGTENMIGIIGFGVAADVALGRLDDMAACAGLRDRLEAAMLKMAPQAVVIGRGEQRLPNTLCLGVPGANAETLVIAMDLAGVAISSGSACSSGKVAASHVLKAMHVAPDLAKGALRVSLGWDTSETEIETFLSVWKDVCSKIELRASAA